MDIEKRTFDFALVIIDLYKYLISKHESVISKQLLRSGTSIGANVAEAQAAQSRKDFISKMSIASKETRETYYWLKLLKHSKYLDSFERLDYILDEIQIIVNIITKIVKTSQTNAFYTGSITQNSLLKT
ncbi:MAG TPA: four helix bundle protein [Lentisphaeria bacterium]|nr:MAG: four helix bundle protein [Lentisphaerae bacterium GWF2_38_69]HBM16431.1 four helix bundle protein [Lentisphaeria bacterium]